MPEPMRPHPMTPTFLMAMCPSCSVSGWRRLLRATTGQRQRLLVPGVRRTGIAHGDGHVAVAYAAVFLHLAARRPWRYRRAGSDRLLIGGVARHRARCGDVEEQIGADARLRFVGTGDPGRSQHAD